MFISVVNSIHAVTVVIVWSKTFTILTIGRNLDILHVQLLTKVFFFFFFFFFMNMFLCYKIYTEGTRLANKLTHSV